MHIGSGPIGSDLLDRGRASDSGGGTETAKQSPQALFDVFERYVEGNMAPFDAIWSVKKVCKHSKKRQMVPYSPLRSVQKRQKVTGVTALRSLRTVSKGPTQQGDAVRCGGVFKSAAMPSQWSRDVCSVSGLAAIQ